MTLVLAIIPCYEMKCIGNKSNKRQYKRKKKYICMIHRHSNNMLIARGRRGGRGGSEQREVKGRQKET